MSLFEERVEAAARAMAEVKSADYKMPVHLITDQVIGAYRPAARAALEAADAVVTERDDALAAIERVRAIHRKDARLPDWPECTHCKVGMLQDPVDWPCPTIKVLEGDD